MIKFVSIITSEGIETHFKAKYLHLRCANDSEHKIVVIITIVVAVVIVT